MNRQIGIQTLSKVLKQSKKCQALEKYIFEQVGNTNDIYIWCIYQVVGLILCNTKDIAKSIIKNGKIGWKSPTYESVSAKIDEIDEYIIRPFEVVEGVVKCGKCHSSRTWSIQKQTRSSDEPMTTFSRCVECGYQWSYSG